MSRAWYPSRRNPHNECSPAADGGLITVFFGRRGGWQLMHSLPRNPAPYSDGKWTYNDATFSTLSFETKEDAKDEADAFEKRTIAAWRSRGIVTKESAVIKEAAAWSDYLNRQHTP
jgi:hypothetical protein